MTPRELSTRDRMIVSTALLVREQGARATSIDDVLAHSGAPRGSVYHHFPGGRDELLREATAYAGGVVDRALQRGASDPVEAFDGFLEAYRSQLLATGFRAGCPVVAVAIEAREDDDAGLREEAAAVFGHWAELLSDNLRAAGIGRRRAGELGLIAISAAEGALVLSRAQRDTAPLDAVRNELRRLLEAELPDRTEHR